MLYRWCQIDTAAPVSALCTIVFHPQNGVRSYVHNESFNTRYHLEDGSFIQHGVTHSKGQPGLNKLCLQEEIL